MFRRRDEDDIAYQIQPVNKNVAQTASNANQNKEKEEVQIAPVPFIKSSQMAAANTQPEVISPEPLQASPVREVNLAAVTPQPREREVSAPAKPAKVQSPNFVPSALRASASQLNAVPANNSNIQPLNVNLMTNSTSKSLATNNPVKIDSLGVEAERRLTVGYGISLQGRVSNCDKLVIYGTVNAELDNVKALHISDSGKFIGGAEVDFADISGNFEGELKVRKTITINSTGKVSGKITYGSIEIKPGGKFTGEIIEDKTLSENNDEATSTDATGNKQEFDLSEITDQKSDKAA